MLLAGLSLVVSSAPVAAQTPTNVPLTGTASSGSGGTSLVTALGDLKKFPCTSPNIVCHAEPGDPQAYEVRAADYDDDPGGNPGSPTFFVSPNPDDNPLQHAWKIIFIDFNGTNDVGAIQKAIRWKAAAYTTPPLGPDQNPANQIVYERVVDVVAAPGHLLTGAACTSFLGDLLTPGTPAHGLIATGQMDSATLQNLKNRCQQNEVGVHPNNFTVSKHLPPGTYEESITLLYRNGGSATPFLKNFVVNELTAYKVDFAAGISFPGNIAKDQQTVRSGDWDITTAGAPTIEGTGNTSPVLQGRWRPLLNVQPDGSKKLICNDFDIQINRRGAASPPALIEYDRLDAIYAGQATPIGAADCVSGTTPPFKETIFGPFFLLDGPSFLVGTRPSSGAVCLEPNEPLKLDFSVTPRQPVFSGAYSGFVEVSVVVLPASCTPSLDSGESSTGDADGVFNNNPSQSVP